MSLKEEMELALTPAAQALEGKSVAELDAMRQELLAGKGSFHEMNEDEVQRYIAIVHMLRTTARTASKPPKAGGSTALKRRIRDERPLSDLLDF